MMEHCGKRNRPKLSISNPDCPRDRFKSFSRQLSAIWTGRTFSRWPGSSDRRAGVEVHEKIIEVMAAVLGPAPTAIAIITSTINALKAMKPDSSWITIFTRELQKAKIARFQVGLVEQKEDAGVFVSLLACLIEAQSTITQVLVFKYTTSSATFSANSSKVSINRAALNELRPMIRNKFAPIRRTISAASKTFNCLTRRLLAAARWTRGTRAGGDRDQARRLPVHRPARRRPRTPVHPSGSRLDRPGAGGSPRRSRSLPVTSATIDGEAVVCDSADVSDFDGLRAALARRASSEVFLYAFDLLELDGCDLRYDPWNVRRETLAGLLRKASNGIRLSEHVDGADGTAVFRHACAMGLEGIVAKRRDWPYRSGRSPD